MLMASCIPPLVDSNQPASNIASYLDAAARWHKAGAKQLIPMLKAPCSGFGCAYTDNDLPAGVLGKGRILQTRIKRLGEEMGKHVAAHELGHALMLPHLRCKTVDGKFSVMHPFVNASNGLISTCELTWLCGVMPGRCAFQAPEIEALDKFDVYVPKDDGTEELVPYDEFQERVRVTGDFISALVSLGDALK